MQILPLNHYLDDGVVSNIFYLEGPVLGGGGWQSRAGTLLQFKLGYEPTVAIPCHVNPGHPDYPYVRGTRRDRGDRAWRNLYTHAAADQNARGCMAIWGPRDRRSTPRPDSQYAKETMNELEKWSNELAFFPGSHLVIGAQEGFPRLEEFRRMFRRHNLIIHRTLGETIDAAVEMSRVLIPR